MAKMRQVVVNVSESHAERIEHIEKRSLDDIIHDVITQWFEDERRRDIPTKRQGISWSKPVYLAMLKSVGEGGISRFVRQAVWEDLSKLEKDLIPIPDWKEGRGVKQIVRPQRKTPPDRLALQAPIIFPEQWIERIENRWPGKVSTYIKACTQIKLEKLIGKELPTQKGMGSFLGR